MEGMKGTTKDIVGTCLGVMNSIFSKNELDHNKKNYIIDVRIIIIYTYVASIMRYFDRKCQLNWITLVLV